MNPWLLRLVHEYDFSGSMLIELATEIIALAGGSLALVIAAFELRSKHLGQEAGKKKIDHKLDFNS